MRVDEHRFDFAAFCIFCTLVELTNHGIPNWCQALCRWLQSFFMDYEIPSLMRKIVLSFLCLGLNCFGVAQNLPRVIILATGGTIAGQGTSATSAGYTPGK